MLSHSDFWIWDSWYVDDGTFFHAFFLQAPRSLIDPDKRHLNATVGHARSLNLIDWEYLGTAFMPSENGFDNQAIWTGCIVRDEKDQWHFFYTGISQKDLSAVQRIGHAVSKDLNEWERLPGPILESDSRWYQQRDDVSPPDQPFRDPWVFKFQDKWHMVITSNLRNGSENHRATMAHAISTDLFNWEIQEPLINSETHFRQMEVFQIEKINQECVAIFCMNETDVNRSDIDAKTATYWMPAESLLGPFHFEKAQPIKEQIYAGRLIKDRDGIWKLLGFVNVAADGKFGGYICNPIPFG